MKHIRDPLYGYITVHEDELPVVSSSPVQRLRRVNQLGLSSVVYPSATHTRFEHSLGVMHLAGKMAESVGLSDSLVKSYRMAGLLHDIGHSPFSHASETVVEDELGIDHEEQSCSLVAELATNLPESVSVEVVQEIIRGDSKFPIVHGAADVDRMDYLQRDAYNTGIPHGNIDVETLIQFSNIVDGEVTFPDSSLSAIEGLFNARFHMTESVYGHHASKIAESMLERSIASYLEESSMSIETIARLDDYKLHTYLKDSEFSEDGLYDRLANRNLYKRALFVGEHDIGRTRLSELESNLSDQVRSIEEEISELAGVSTSDVIVDPPRTPNLTEPNVLIERNDTVVSLSDLSPKPGELVDAEWRTTTLGVYSPPEIQDTVSAAAEEVLLL